MAAELEKLSPESDVTLSIPQHIAVIMDGNGRWAEQRSKPRHAGHRAGVASVKRIVEQAASAGVSYLTLFAFSSENWGRPSEEVGRLMGLFFDVLQREVDDLHRNKVRLRFVGQLELLSGRLVKRIRAAETQTAANTGLQLNVAVAFGGRWDITNAVRRVAERVESGEIRAQDIDEQLLADGLAIAGMPDPDLLIRTGGEHRISNFLLWNLAYTELYFCEGLWPDFGEAEFNEALRYFSRRQRRFGKTAKQQGSD